MQLNFNDPLEQVSQNEQVRQLYQQHHQKLIHHIMKKGLVQREAEDIAQEAFIKLLGLDKPEIESYIAAYLYKIANNLTIDRLRSQARSPIEFDEQLQINSIDTLANPEQSNQHQQVLSQMAVLIKQLPIKCQQAFILYKVKECSYEQISEQLDISQSMVRKYVLRAIRHCYDHLQHEL
ncbi:RNA polymerase sigma factor [Pseudoalteromonas tunicata]|uniref:RNA polymerase sigma factor, sigma-70 family protein n=1 Tax=Pseudoalteromonas tunicata D2 TaxID=87626 RepID=A4C3P4_9GAMM|nr:RNA polymerase sigma factor [Pseudoalteromonas tunicata]ATC96545.1 RNA polymerase sigma-70 factor, ECF subfamily [Pseudoalteromonas tunicata]AXT33407.1 RNA polymerase sigma factor [Pseudoalteromonas tunicata]EAR30176.1 RNA polymerase sigma factor, sigma-70 family protein [Pseudoalteromonas tunicata D2]MDP4984490.1 RNA polymerase sigma factor [Pseudoalteromonas tunicata]MDP5215079.1 RNA polymerase sigma factor [Pseudoalteromonas tunicata]